jgi:hypothetical protein
MSLIVASLISGGISSVTTLIAICMRLRHLDRRDRREADRYESAALYCSDAYYRGGETALRAMSDVQVDLLRATAPEPRRGLIDQIRRTPERQRQQLPPRRVPSARSGISPPTMGKP